MEVKFYRCKHCGNIIIKVVDSKVPVVCCGEKMEELIPASVDAAVEKHVPVIEIKDGVVYVSVGSVAHPMTEEHYIPLVVLETTAGVQIAELHLILLQIPVVSVLVQLRDLVRHLRSRF